jgi:hypothetical protein
MATKLSAYLESGGFAGPIFYQLIFFKKRRIPVGTPVIRCPPDRSQRAELPHWAPALGNDAHSPAAENFKLFDFILYFIG